jgi:hypothetical protein
MWVKFDTAANVPGTTLTWPSPRRLNQSIADLDSWAKARYDDDKQSLNTPVPHLFNALGRRANDNSFPR